jgi:serine/threonine protein kinase
MLVMKQYDMDLREYLRQNQLTWIERIKIVNDISVALSRIHKVGMIHKNLHPGNILYSRHYNYWFIGDLGFCSPTVKQSKIYGNFPYIAPEVITREYNVSSDIYSLAMIMWEISSGQMPFANCENDYDLALNIAEGTRPKIVWIRFLSFIFTLT